MTRVLIGYDIADNRRRRQALKLLRSVTACYQESFFDCDLSRSQLDVLVQQLTALLDTQQDGLILAWLRPGQHSALGQRWTEGGQSLYLIT
ncbi:CRISPR-associated endonuclease Cas2 [Pseudomonas wenzhouensis]|nr:CRISPR-associated endonuclease Cas2 [Pseudomonas wenzhouensis]MDM9652056.1 CRISPR-associated endonuclease Cas2 [Pseudomonas wenzhouensis]